MNRRDGAIFASKQPEECLELRVGLFRFHGIASKAPAHQPLTLIGVAIC